MDSVSAAVDNRAAPSASRPYQASPTAVGKDQRLRVLRLMMAGASSVTWIALLYLYAGGGLIALSTVHAFAAFAAASYAVVGACFAAGLNRRFPDPSLTGVQMTATGLALAYLAYAGGPFRAAQLPFYMSAMLLGSFRLGTRALLAHGAFFVATYAVALWLRPADGALARTPSSMLLVAHLAALLAVMAGIGGYINWLRIQLRTKNHELKQALSHIERIATYDELTGVYNRRSVFEIARREKKRCERKGADLCVAMVDADHFKRFNDRYGHAVGDDVLRMLGRTLKAALREADVAGRYGGEEFLVLLPETTRSHGSIPLERLREHIGAAMVESLPEGERVTVSVGAACHRQGSDILDTIRRADAALYEAKRAGRDRIVWDAD